MKNMGRILHWLPKYQSGNTALSLVLLYKENDQELAGYTVCSKVHSKSTLRCHVETQGTLFTNGIINLKLLDL